MKQRNKDGAGLKIKADKDSEPHEEPRAHYNEAQGQTTMLQQRAVLDKKSFQNSCKTQKKD